MKILRLVLLGSTLLGTSFIVVADAPWHRFGLDGQSVLCVADRDMNPYTSGYADESVNLQIDHGHTPGFGYFVNTAEMRRLFPSFKIKAAFEQHPFINKLTASIDFIGPFDRQRLGPAMRARDTEDEWYANGKCPRSVVTVIPGTSYFEVKCAMDSDYASLWSRSPAREETMPLPNTFVVATCLYKVMPSVGPYAGNTSRTCSRAANFGDFLVDYQFEEENAVLIPAIDSMLKDKIGEWKRNCSSGTTKGQS